MGISPRCFGANVSGFSESMSSLDSQSFGTNPKHLVWTAKLQWAQICTFNEFRNRPHNPQYNGNTEVTTAKAWAWASG
jgi:hypothetical protein